MSWWCTATRAPWTWEWKAYPGVWLFVALVATAWLVGLHRTKVDATRRQRLAFWGGVATLWLSTDWPLGALGAGYLASAHMLQYVLITFVAAPLLLLGIPEPLARRALAATRTYRLVRTICRPVAAAVAVNVILVATHAPVTVDALRTNQFGSFFLDLAWVVGGLLLWMPVIGPLPEAKPSEPVRIVYLFLAAGVVPMIPGGFLAFSGFALYETFELAPRVWDWSPADDQQVAGALMKVGNIPLVWPVMATIFWRWATKDGQPTVPPGDGSGIDAKSPPEPAVGGPTTSPGPLDR